MLKITPLYYSIDNINKKRNVFHLIFNFQIYPFCRLIISDLRIINIGGKPESQQARKGRISLGANSLSVSHISYGSMYMRMGKYIR